MGKITRLKEKIIVARWEGSSFESSRAGNSHVCYELLQVTNGPL